MIYSDVIQKTADWYLWKKTGVGASEASTILGLNPDKGVWTLWAEKTSRGIPENLDRNPLVRKGNYLEPRARKCAELALQEPMLIPVCARSALNPNAIASLDGLTVSLKPVELKVPAPSTYEDVCKLGENSKAYARYIPQMQHQLLVTGADFGWLFFYNPDDSGDYRAFKIFRDEILIATLSMKISEFMSAVLSGVPPEKDPTKDVFFPTQEKDIRTWKFHAAGYAMIDKAIQLKTNELEMLKQSAKVHQDALTDIMGEYAWADYAGINVVKVVRKGNVNYKKVFEQKSISLTENELDAFRAEQTSYFKISTNDELMPKNIIDSDVKNTLEGFEPLRTSRMF